MVSGVLAILNSNGSFVPHQVQNWQRGQVEVIHEWWAQPNRVSVHRHERPLRQIALLRKLVSGESYKKPLVPGESCKKSRDESLVYAGIVKIGASGFTEFKFTGNRDPYSVEWLAPHIAARLVEEKEMSLQASFGGSVLVRDRSCVGV